MQKSSNVGRAALCIVLLSGSAAWAAEGANYHLLSRRPSADMRDLSTDRPDKTESPYTVDAGHAQMEVDVVAYTYDRDTSGGADAVSKQWSVGNTNYKVGLLNRVDLQVVVESFSHQKVEDRAAGTVESRSGFGDITPRLKINLWGNDGGRTAFALMPFVKVPTNRNGLGNQAVEGGMIVPLAIELPADFALGVMTQVDYSRNAADDGHHPEFINTLTVGRDIVGSLAGYLEFFSNVSTDDGAEWVGTVDAGLTYAIKENIQLDAGVNVGVTKSADNINPFLGLAVRF